MKSSACESIVLITGLKPFMQVMQWSISSENFILFKYNNFRIKELINHKFGLKTLFKDRLIDIAHHAKQWRLGQHLHKLYE